MYHRRNEIFPVILAVLMIIALLVFAWRATDLILNPKPTAYPTTTRYISPTAPPTQTPSAPPTVSQPSPLPPTFTRTVSDTATPTKQQTVTAAPTTALLTPTRTLIPYIIVEDKEPDCMMYVFINGRYICYPYCREWQQ